MNIVIKRAYEPATEADGFRILVDRLWPRGVSKAVARIDLWAKSTSPSTELRQWYDHDPAKWAEFQKRYKAELKANPDFDTLKQTVAEHPVVTLIYSAKNDTINNAVVLRQVLLRAT